MVEYRGLSTGSLASMSKRAFAPVVIACLAFNCVPASGCGNVEAVFASNYEHGAAAAAGGAELWNEERLAYAAYRASKSWMCDGDRVRLLVLIEVPPDPSSKWWNFAGSVPLLRLETDEEWLGALDAVLGGEIPFRKTIHWNWNSAFAPEL